MTLTELREAALQYFLPPKVMNVADWADNYRVLSSVNSAEPGQWNTSRAEYQREIMNSFSDPTIEKIVIKASAQCGKSEILNNCLGYTMAVDPGPVMMVQPTEELAKAYSKERISPMIESSPALCDLVSESKTRDSSNTILGKRFPGGFLSLVGANAPSGLRSRPIRVLILDEVDAFPKSAGSEGDPVKLAMKRTQTFHNRKIIMCSTPTIKGASKIDREYKTGTQEEWQAACPNCGQYHFITFRNIKFEHEKYEVEGRTEYSVHDIAWVCPSCDTEHSELAMKAAPKAWMAKNEKKRSEGIRSFWINAFLSPWQTWQSIVRNFLEAKDNNEELQVFFNTVLGEVWEIKDRTGRPEKMLERLEDYEAEVPEGALVLTCGLDTQDNRIEYEVVGWGMGEESWGIQVGVIPGSPDNPQVWKEIDALLDKEWQHAGGRRMKISCSFIDSGGHYTQEIYRQCNRRMGKHIYAIKGRAGQGYPFVERSKKGQLLFLLGVDSGKAMIMQSLEVKEEGAKYCHFPREMTRGYARVEYFRQLLSERLVVNTKRGRNHMVWEKVEGVVRNEMLDCRNYALAAFKGFPFDLHKARQRLLGEERVKLPEPGRKKDRRVVSRGIEV